MISFFVAGEAKAMSVGKGVRVPNKGGGFRQFQTRVNTEWSTLVGYAGRQHAPREPFQGPVELRCLFVLRRPTSVPKRAPAWPVKRPDLDNLVHKLTDQWNGVFWADDSQVTWWPVAKVYQRPGLPVGAFFQVRTLDADPPEVVAMAVAAAELVGRGAVGEETRR